jgi:putative transposase
VTDILVAMVDGLAGLAEAVETVFPQTSVHQCVVHLVRQSLQFVSWKERKGAAAALRLIYSRPE